MVFLRRCLCVFFFREFATSLYYKCFGNYLRSFSAIPNWLYKLHDMLELAIFNKIYYSFVAKSKYNK